MGLFDNNSSSRRDRAFDEGFMAAMMFDAMEQDRKEREQAGSSLLSYSTSSPYGNPTSSSYANPYGGLDAYDYDGHEVDKDIADEFSGFAEADMIDDISDYESLGDFGFDF